MKYKGPTIFSEQERYSLVRSIKWVDEVVEDVPYETSFEILKTHNCGFVAHGDDIAFNSKGEDVYKMFKEKNIYLEYSRTVGVSTTDLIARIINVYKNISSKGDFVERNSLKSTRKLFPSSDILVGNSVSSPYTNSNLTFFPNALRISQFTKSFIDGNGKTIYIREPSKGELVIYCPDIGHLEFLKKCKSIFQNSYLLVGLYNDKTCAAESGDFGSIMNVNERLLNLLACRIDKVLVGYSSDLIGSDDPMKVPKAKGIFHLIQSDCEVSTRDIVNRILENRKMFEKRNREKENKEIKLIFIPTD